MIAYHGNEVKKTAMVFRLGRTMAETVSDENALYWNNAGKWVKYCRMSHELAMDS